MATTPTNNQKLNGNFLFEGFRSINGTIVPDVVFDELMPFLTGAELKVLLYIIRRTTGFKKDQDDISIRQMTNGIVRKNGKRLDHGAGVSSKSAVTASKKLHEKKIIRKTKNSSPERGDLATTYALRFRADEDTEADNKGKNIPHSANGDPLSKNSTGGGVKITYGGMKKLHTQQTEEQQTDNTLRKASPKKNETGVGEREEKPPPTNGSSPPSGSTHKLGDVIASMELPAPDPPTPSGSTLTKAERQSIRLFVHDMRGEFRDKLPIHATTAQLCNLYEEAKDKHGDKMSHQVFYNFLYESRAITRHAGHRVKGTKMGFMVGVMREKLKLDGLNEPLEQPPPSRAKPLPNPDATKMSHQDPTELSQPDTTSQDAVPEKPELDQKQFGYTVALLKRRKLSTQSINQAPPPPNDRDISSLDKTKKAEKKQNQLQPPPRPRPSMRSGVG